MSINEFDEKIKGLSEVLGKFEEIASNIDVKAVDTVAAIEFEPGKIEIIEIKSSDGKNFKAVSSTKSWNFTASQPDNRTLEISLPGYFNNKRFLFSQVLINSRPGAKSFQKAQDAFKRRLMRAGIDDDKFAFHFTVVLLTLLREGWLKLYFNKD